MKLKRIVALGWLAGSLLCCGYASAAQDVVPCLIFTGNADTDCRIDLEKLNRITFGDSSMTVSSSRDNSEPDEQLEYSLYNRIEIGDAVPSARLMDVNNDESTQLRYLADTKSLVIESVSDMPYSIGIFNINGTLIATSAMSAGQTLSVDALACGVYIAVASNDESSLTLKFVIN